MADSNNSVNREPLQIGGRRGGLGPVVLTEKPKNAKNTAKRLLSYISGNRVLFYSLIGITLITTAVNLAIPALQRLAIDAVTIDGIRRLNVDFAQLGVMIALLLLAYVITSSLTYLQGKFSAGLSQAAVKNIRRDLLGRLIRLPVRFTDTHSHGDLISRMTNDAENISNSVSQALNSLISGVIIIIGSLAVMLYFSPVLTLLSLTSIVLAIFASYFMSMYMRKYFRQQQNQLGNLNGHIEEMITGFYTVTAFGKQADSLNVFNNISSDLKKSGIKSQIISGAVGPVMNIISNTGFLIIAVFGGSLAFKGVITIGTIQAFILYTKQFSRSINEIANQYALIQTAIAGAERIFEVLDEETESDTNTVPFKAEYIAGDISFKDVNFSYTAGRPVLKNFSLEIKSGEKVAFVGATGSGKTTIVNLLMKYYDDYSGAITVDGVDIKSVNRHELRRAIAVVLQDTVLFSGSVEDNIKYGRPDASIDEMQDAAIFANADNFIEKLPDDYRTILSENGGSLSSGQRQLLAIARAMLANPKILILDEATSNVDTRTELDLQSAMTRLMKNRTSIIIAHRISTIRDADKIVVIENGQIAETGGHEELIALKGAYYNLYKRQFEGRIT